MFGKLGLDAIPYDPIVQATVVMMILGGLVLVAGITYFKKWGTCGMNGSHL